MGFFTQVDSPGKDATSGASASMRQPTGSKSVDGAVPGRTPGGGSKDGGTPTRPGALLSDTKACPEGSVLISPGTHFNQTGAAGSEPRDPSKGRGFRMDVFEFPNVRTGQPAIDKTWKEAEGLCEAEGKRLCSESEWESACTSGEGRDYPYGTAYDGNKCNTQSRTRSSGYENSKCRARFGQPAEDASKAIGFRCCADFKP